MVIGDLADGHLADGAGIQHDTLSRWRSWVRIPSGSPLNSFPHKGIQHIGQIADPASTKRQWPKSQYRLFHIPAKPENTIGQSANMRLPSAEYTRLFRRIASIGLV